MSNKSKDQKSGADKAAASVEDKSVNPDHPASASTIANEKPAGPARERPAKPAESAPTPDAPYPTQADLDAMRDGTFRHGREAKADDKSVGYKTR